MLGGVLAAAFVALAPSARADEVVPCTISGTGTLLGRLAGILVHGKCVSYGGPGADVSGTPVATRVVGCALGDDWQIKRCGPVAIDCPPLPGQTKPPEAFITQAHVGTAWIPVGDPWCAGQDNPVPTPGMIRDQAVRLIPKIGIGAAPPGGKTLVNIQTLLWTRTPGDRALGTVTVLGHRVALRAHFDHATWTFGDGTSATTGTPGRPFTASDYCDTKQCPGFFGHVYRTTGPMTIRLTVTWTARFRLAGTGEWVAVPGTLDGPTATQAITVVAARGELVAQ